MLTVRVTVHSMSGITIAPGEKLLVAVAVPTKDSGREEQAADAVKNCQDFKARRLLAFLVQKFKY
jgi:hypothetical protein